MEERAEHRTRGAGERDFASSPLRGGGYENSGAASPAPATPRPLVRGVAFARCFAAFRRAHRQ